MFTLIFAPGNQVRNAVLEINGLVEFNGTDDEPFTILPEPLSSDLFDFAKCLRRVI